MLKSDKWIIEKSKQEKPLIWPFEERLIKKAEHTDYKILSYGTSSYGYDCTLSEFNFKNFSPGISNLPIDPKNFNSCFLRDSNLINGSNGQYFLLPAHTYALGVTLETFQLPSNVTGLLLNKSTYARCGILISVTILQAGWVGELVLEIYNAASVPVKLYANEGIAQILFFESDESCTMSYADISGKYQNQKGVTYAKC